MFEFMEILTVAMGFGIGVILGLTGAGGGVLAIPVLMFGMSWSIQEATPISMLAVTLSSMVGALIGLREGIVRYRAAMVIALVSVPFSRMAWRWAQNLNEGWLLVLFAAIVLISAYRLLNKQNAEAHTPILNLNPNSGRFIWSPKTVLVFSSLGVFSGTLTGLLGVGGGFVIVPLLKNFTTLSMRSLAATSMMIVSLVSMGGLVNVMSQGATINWTFAGAFSVLMVLGMFSGKYLSKKISDKATQYFFAYLLLLLAVLIVFKAFNKLYY